MNVETKKTVVIELTIAEYCEVNNALINLADKLSNNDANCTIPEPLLALRDAMARVGV